MNDQVKEITVKRMGGEKALIIYKDGTEKVTAAQPYDVWFKEHVVTNVGSSNIDKIYAGADLMKAIEKFKFENTVSDGDKGIPIVHIAELPLERAAGLPFRLTAFA